MSCYFFSLLLCSINQPTKSKGETTLSASEKRRHSHKQRIGVPLTVRGTDIFLPPFSHTLILYLCFAAQMALLELYYDSALFSSPLTSIHAGACGNRHYERVRESAHGAGTQENRSTINFDCVWV